MILFQKTDMEKTTMDRNVEIITDESGKMYLYDILDIKKETSNSLGS